MYKHPFNHSIIDAKQELICTPTREGGTTSQGEKNNNTTFLFVWHFSYLINDVYGKVRGEKWEQDNEALWLEMGTWVSFRSHSFWNNFFSRMITGHRFLVQHTQAQSLFKKKCRRKHIFLLHRRPLYMNINCLCLEVM